MLNKYDVKIVYCDGSEEVFKKCGDYGWNGAGNFFYYMSKKDIQDMQTVEKVNFVPVENIKTIIIDRLEIFETKKEKIEFIKAGGLRK